MGLSTNYKNRIINALVGRQQMNFGMECWVGLATAEPTESGTTITTHELALGSGGSGPSAGYNATTGYQRVIIGNYNQSYSQKMSAADGGSSSNITQILFNRALTNWGQITHVLFFDSATGTSSSNVIGWAPVIGPSEHPTYVQIDADDVANFNLGAISLSLIDTTGS